MAKDLTKRMDNSKGRQLWAGIIIGYVIYAMTLISVPLTKQILLKENGLCLTLISKLQHPPILTFLYLGFTVCYIYSNAQFLIVQLLEDHYQPTLGSVDEIPTCNLDITR